MLFLQGYNSSLKLKLESKSRSRAAIQIEHTLANTPDPDGHGHQTVNAINQNENFREDRQIEVAKLIEKSSLSLKNILELYKRKLNQLKSNYAISDNFLLSSMPINQIIYRLYIIAQYFLSTLIVEEKILTEVNFKEHCRDIMNLIKLFKNGSDFEKQYYIILILELIENWKKSYNIDEETMKISFINILN